MHIYLFLFVVWLTIRSGSRVVGLVNRCGLDGQGSELWLGRDEFSYPYPYRLALGATEPPV
jgi:hypothetical protein